jgi:hypothetical protein
VADNTTVDNGRIASDSELGRRKCMLVNKPVLELRYSDTILRGQLDSAQRTPDRKCPQPPAALWLILI